MRAEARSIAMDVYGGHIHTDGRRCLLCDKIDQLANVVDDALEAATNALQAESLSVQATLRTMTERAASLERELDAYKSERDSNADGLRVLAEKRDEAQAKLAVAVEALKQAREIIGLGTQHDGPDVCFCHVCLGIDAITKALAKIEGGKA